jgi:arylamine N-acetyltransferase
MNMATSMSPKSLFLNTIVCTRVDYDDLKAVSRTILVNNRLKKRINGESQELALFQTEEERVEALEKIFGIKLSTEEREGIKNRALSVENLNPNTLTFPI